MPSNRVAYEKKLRRYFRGEEIFADFVGFDIIRGKNFSWISRMTDFWIISRDEITI